MALGPININEDNWMYDDRDTLDLIHWCRSTDGSRRLHCSQISIPWKAIRIALARKDKKKRPRGVGK
jgi:hypothetical protein